MGRIQQLELANKTLLGNSGAKSMSFDGFEVVEYEDDRPTSMNFVYQVIDGRVPEGEQPEESSSLRLK